jgi:chemotaxis protein MotB
MAKPAKGGAPSWMVTFADMMALLLCLFVLLLSFAEMERNTFKQIAGSLQQAFGVALKSRLLGMIEIGGSPHKKAYRDVKKGPVASISLPEPTDKQIMEAEPEVRPEVKQSPPDQTLNTIQTVLADEIEGKVLNVSEKGGKVVIRFPDKTVFPSGTARLTPEFKPTLDKVARVLAAARGDITVAGHTDNIPIRTAQFPSNWELSSARAASVVLYLIEHADIAPPRVTASGYADSRPVASNETEEGRAKNRRVEITIIKGDGEKSEAD